ncbi:MAG: hypothetical protein DKINENOH_04880 [bacterium]|nr:hypothetical protein [bacterium]
MLGIRNSFKKPRISPRSPHVLWRTCPLASNTNRIFGRLFRKQYLLNKNIVFPAIAKVVFVLKPPLGRWCHGGKGMVSLVNNWLPIFWTGNAVVFPVDEELMQVVIEPAESGLDNSMQLVESETSRDKNATPDGWAYFVEGYLELIYGGVSFGDSF